MVAGTTNYQNPCNQYSRVKDLALPPKYNRDNPFGHDIVVLRLKKRFKLDECYIRQEPFTTWTRTILNSFSEIECVKLAVKNIFFIEIQKERDLATKSTDL